jgi:hypothetical protein
VPVVLDGVVKADWREFATSTDHRGRQRVTRIVYERSVLEALRDRLRCKEIWVVGADRWRNPDEDLPPDFAEKREENYAELNLPLGAKQFIDNLKDEMRRELTGLNAALPDLDWLEISDRKAARDQADPGRCAARDAEPAQAQTGVRRPLGHRPADRDAQGSRATHRCLACADRCRDARQPARGSAGRAAAADRLRLRHQQRAADRRVP